MILRCQHPPSSLHKQTDSSSRIDKAVNWAQPRSPRVRPSDWGGQSGWKLWRYDLKRQVPLSDQKQNIKFYGDYSTLSNTAGIRTSKVIWKILVSNSRIEEKIIFESVSFSFVLCCCRWLDIVYQSSQTQRKACCLQTCLQRKTNSETKLMKYDLNEWGGCFIFHLQKVTFFRDEDNVKHNVGNKG